MPTYTTLRIANGIPSWSCPAYPRTNRSTICLCRECPHTSCRHRCSGSVLSTSTSRACPQCSAPRRYRRCGPPSSRACRKCSARSKHPSCCPISMVRAHPIHTYRKECRVRSFSVHCPWPDSGASTFPHRWAQSSSRISASRRPRPHTAWHLFPQNHTNQIRPHTFWCPHPSKCQISSPCCAHSRHTPSCHSEISVRPPPACSCPFRAGRHATSRR